MAGDRERCLTEGMNDYLSKPLQLNMLAKALAKWLPALSPEKEIRAQVRLNTDEQESQ
jgi:CheY-like chemotaxis protein